MNKKEVREWIKAHKEATEDLDALRKELESKDLPGLLAMTVVTEVMLERIKLIVIAEILRSRGVLDQTNRG